MLFPEIITPNINNKIEDDNKLNDMRDFTLNYNNDKTFKIILSLNEKRKNINITCTSTDIFTLIEYNKSLILDELIAKNYQFKSFDNIKGAFNLLIQLFEKEKVCIKEYKEKEMINIEIKLLSLLGEEQSVDIRLYQREINKDKKINQLLSKINSLEKEIKEIKEDNLKKDKEIESLKNSLNEFKNNKNELNKNQNAIIENGINDIHFRERRPNIYIKIPPIKNNNFINSTIIKDNNLDFVLKELKTIYNIKDNNNKNLKTYLLYKASIDGFDSIIFHNKCDNIKGTLILVENNRGIQFGGFTMETWDGNSIDKKDENAFCFSISIKKIYKIKKNKNAIKCDINFGPVFLNDIFGFRKRNLKIGESFPKKDCNYSGCEYDFEINGWEQVIECEEIEVFNVFVE